MKFYSNSTKLCYDDMINPDIPDDAIQIEDSVFMEILDLRGKSADFIVTPDGIVDILDIPDLTEEIERTRKLNEASAYLFSTDWYIIRQVETGKQIPDIVVQKRAECREILSDERVIG